MAEALLDDLWKDVSAVLVRNLVRMGCKTCESILYGDVEESCFLGFAHRERFLEFKCRKLKRSVLALTHTRVSGPEFLPGSPRVGGAKLG